MRDYHQKTEDQFIVTTCPHEDIDKIYKDFFEPTKTPGGYRKKIPNHSTLRKYITDMTLAHIYMLIGIEWIHTTNTIGLDLRKFTKKEVFVFRSFIEKTFKIEGQVARATDANFVIVFFMDEALKFLDIIEEFVIKALYTKLGDHYFGGRDEINFGPAILKLSVDPIEIVKEKKSEELETTNDE